LHLVVDKRIAATSFEMTAAKVYELESENPEFRWFPVKDWKKL